MMPKTYSFVLIVAMLFTMVGVSHAQMINYKRRNQKTTVKKSNADMPKKSMAQSSQDSINYYRRDYQDVGSQAQVSSDPQVTNRVERLYDLNRDGYLQSDEVNDFYKDVVSSVRNRGSFRVSSDLLKGFDANRDGRISRYEITEITNQLN